MKKVTSLGGIFFRSKDPENTKAWYQKHLGLRVGPYGTNFEWRHADQPDQKGFTLWSPFDHHTDYFGSTDQDFMISFRVDDLEALVIELRAEGVTIIDEIATYEYGKFVHILDADDRRIELWEPNDEYYDQMIEARTK
ncbi:VOC family protein [Phaeodactylibacter sp.]|uniref:VOC family protein n=1 Tax=Phaeodactylibacter sp. TaxID=1940289 RepID=UPI0025E24830|nr:VOC family protein [Phaeodactylibacter sp.]MCI4647856.1 VOC family protein [Phaeodactylibacter sp.]MCI5089444.1 VOC family protein [Phaeodactylibacter sp.]